jgi:hypothetical protein
LQRHGDDIYRMALLLTPDSSSAATALSRAVRGLAAASPAVPDEAALINALIMELPPERARYIQRGLPEWVVAAPNNYAATCVATARLPRQQRLVLGLLTLWQWDAERIAQFIGGDVSATQAMTRDALLALAPQAMPDLDTDAMRSANVPDACRSTRAALGLNDAALRHDPAVRGHLALCSDCRAVEHDWQQLSDAVEEALRNALRQEHMPAVLGAEVQAGLAAPAQSSRALPRIPTRWWRVLLPLGVVALIAILVFPKSSPAAPESNTAASALDPLPLVQRAAANLYQPPTDERAQHPYDVWHGRWQMRWDFSDNSYATLVGDVWRDTGSNRHRVQLVHEKGGGPFEFELADGQKLVYYATTENYGDSLYPRVFDNNNARLMLHVPNDEQPRMLEARLNTGAWGLARAYLQHAAAAKDLRSWGQQRTPDGATVVVLGFRGASPLGLPAGAPDAEANLPTILLTINMNDSTLREVRELTGPPGGEQIGRTIWRFAGGEWISTTPQISAAFSLEQAWNGIGSFRDLGQTVANPALPVVAGDTVHPLADAVTNQLIWGWLPATPPPGTTAAVLFENTARATNTFDGIAVYTGDGRYLAVQSVFLGDNAHITLPGGNVEQSNHGDKIVQLQPGIHHGYEAVVEGVAQSDLPNMSVQLSARGFSRDELLQVISGLRPLDAQSYRAQEHLFSDTLRNNSAESDVRAGTRTSAMGAFSQ